MMHQQYQLVSPLLPATEAGGGKGGKGGQGCGSVAPSLDVFSYPSDMMHMASILPGADGEPSECTTGQGAFCGPNDASTFSADVAGWDFVSPEPAVTGARLWQRVRTRLDTLARTQGMSRCKLLVYVLLTLAAHPSSRFLHFGGEPCE